MKVKDFPLLLIFIFISIQANSQCPIPAFYVADSACKGTAVSFLNSSIGNNLKMEWDFHSNASNILPNSGLLGTFPSDIGTSTGVDLMKEGGNYYGFSLKSFASLVRINFGNSLSNTPVITDLGSLGGLIGSGNRDFKLIKEGGNFYGLINTVSGQLIRLSFGSSLLNTPSASFVNISTSLFASPFNMDVQRMGNDIVAAIANISSGQITIINFGPSITNNTPAAYNISVPGSSPVSTALINDCGDLYAIVGYVSSSPFSIVNFGSSVSSNPISVQQFSFATGFAYRKIQVLKEGGNWNLYANTFGGDALHRFLLGNSPDNLDPLFIQVASPGGVFTSGSWTFSINQFDGEIGGFVCNYNTGDLKWLLYPQSNSIQPSFSNLYDPIIVYDTTGYHKFTLTVTDTVTHLATSITDSIFISEVDESAFTTSDLCTGNLVNFSVLNVNQSSQYLWDLGNGQTGTDTILSTQYPNAGIYDVSLISINTTGCSDTLRISLQVNSPPTAIPVLDSIACAGAPVILTDASTTNQGSITSSTWIISNTDTVSGDQIQFVFLTPGVFPIQLIADASTGCNSVTSDSITILPGPLTGFNVTNTCIGESVQFQNTTTAAGNVSVDYLWQFTAIDSSTSTDPFFDFAATNPTDFPVTLIGRSENGCADTLIQIIKIRNPPDVDFIISNDTVCSNSVVNFSDSTTIEPGAVIISRQWDYGDGTYDSATTNVSHSYSQPGTYSVTLTVKTESSCISTKSKLITVRESPSCGFTSSAVCHGNATTFIDTSSSSSTSSIVSWIWDFGDSSNPSINQNPIYSYFQPGLYNVSLIITDNFGCSDTSQSTTYVYPLPNAFFKNSKACTYNEILFTDSSQISNGTITGWEWFFGDGTSVSGQANPSHIYAVPAAYAIKLIVTSQEGCIDSIERLLIVETSPEFTLSESKSCFGNPNSFGFNLTGIPVTNPGYNWDFGDSTSSSQAQPIHYYTTPGTKKVLFTLSNLQNGCQSTDSIFAEVIPNPVAAIISDSICYGDTLLFLDNSQSGADSIVNYQWSAGQGYSSSTSYLQLTGIDPGPIPVTLIIETDFGCRDSATATGRIFPRPKVGFSADQDFGNPPLFVVFSNESDIGIYLWNFGDGFYSNLSNPNHTFTDTGYYKVTLAVTSSNGCKDSSTKTISVQAIDLEAAILSCNLIETNQTYQIQLIVQNLGNIEINNLEIRVLADNRSPILEKLEGLKIKPGMSDTIILNSQYFIDNESIEYLCAIIIKANNSIDRISTNNESCYIKTRENKILNVYPVPAKESCDLLVNSKENGKMLIGIFNTSGQTSASEITFDIKKGINRITIDLSNNPAGNYILRIILDKDVLFTKIIKE